MHRRTRSTLALSPATAKSLIDQFSTQSSHYHDIPDTHSESSNSPDSLYSNGSPVFPDQAFEFDNSSEIMHVEEHDEEEYESIMGSMEDRDEWRGESWGRWPESAYDTQPGWSPSRSLASRNASIISISPRGSLSGKGSFPGSRRPSTPCSKLRRSVDRRDSDPSLLGFELAQRRRSSVKSLTSSLRRASVISNGSIMDPVEDARLRNIASMDQLRRRFSEVVEVTQASDSEDEVDCHTAIARAALNQMQSPWTPSDYSGDEEDSEIHTAPYVPTPDMPRRPALLSNYPLPSSVRDYDINSPTATPASFSAQPSPVVPPRLIRSTSNPFLGTPPPPARPIDIIRSKVRPAFPRAATDYQFPPRSDGVPAGAAAPRPGLNRSASTPFFSTPQKGCALALSLEKRAAGSFPLGRSTPLGISPLRASQRRESVVSDGASRRSSVVPPEGGRRMSADSRRISVVSSEAVRKMSMVSDGSRRPSVAERRMSIVMGTSLPRKMSSDGRRSSLAQGQGSRRSSTASLTMRRGSSLDPRRGSTADRRSSVASRKSSVVSIGEYGYLAPQIVIDTATPAIPSISALPPPAAIPSGHLTQRRPNAPTSIALPRSNLNAHSAPTTPSGQPRFNPLDAFLGMSPMETPTPASAFIWTPGSDRSSFVEATPRQVSGSIMDRPRPISPPEFLDSFPLRPRLRDVSGSPRSPVTARTAGSADTHVEIASPSIDTHVASSTETHVDESMDVQPPSPKQVGPRMGIVRKAVPQLTVEEMRLAQTVQEKPIESPRHLPRNYLRRGAVELFTPGDDAIPRPAPNVHRRTTSVEHQMTTPKRPAAKRQMTLSPDMQQLAYTSPPRSTRLPLAPETPSPRRHYRDSPFAFSPSQASPPMSRNPAHPIQVVPTSHVVSPPQRPILNQSVTFSPEIQRPPVRPQVERTISSSSFTRFFHSKSKSSSANFSGAPNGQGGKVTRPSLRPVSMEGGSSSSGSDRTLVEVKDIFRKIGSPHSSPRVDKVARPL